jgi:hypothetical protein
MKLLLITIVFSMLPSLFGNTFKSSGFGSGTITLETHIEILRKEEFLAHLKLELLEIMKDVRYFNTIYFNDEHLYFMEMEREYYNIPRAIYYRLIFKESSFRENAVSRVGAKGYMQVMPTTFLWIKERYDLDITDNTDPYDNIKAGSFYLYLMKLKVEKYYNIKDERSVWKRALASYNAGFYAHDIAMNSYTETIDYVNFIMKH